MMDSLNQQAPLVQEQPTTPIIIPPPEQQPAPNRSWLKWILLVVFVALLSSVGIYLVLNQTKEQSTPTSAITQIPSPTPDPTVNWKIYTNEALAFSLKIPLDWGSFETNDRVDFAKKGQPYPLQNEYWVWVSVIPNTNQLSTEQVVDNYLKEIPEAASSITKDYLTVSGTNAISLYPVPSATDTKELYVATKENIYSIVVQAGFLPDLNQEAMNTFSMILSTFKFLE